MKFKNINWNKKKDLFLPFVISIIFILFIDPTKLELNLNKEYSLKLKFFCHDLPMCFRILSIDLYQILIKTFELFFVILKLNLNPKFFSYYILTIFFLTYTFYSLKILIKSNKIYILFIIYIFITLIFFKVPLLRIYDYFVLSFFFYIIKNQEELINNFFSKKSITLLFIGTLIFEYAALVYASSIILFNLLVFRFSKLSFQIKHFMLILIPIIVLLLLYYSLTLGSNYYWVSPGNKSLETVWLEYGKFNNFFSTIKYLINYSLIFFLTLTIFLYFSFINKKLIIKLIKDRNFLYQLSLCIGFLMAVFVGQFTSGFHSEWQRQFLPFLFFSTLLSFYLIKMMINQK